MKQGILTKGRPQVLMSKGHSCYRPRRTGERKRKSVRGCIVDADIRVLAVTVVKKGEKEIEGLTNDEKPRRLGPKRASKIRKYFQIKNDKDNKEQAKVLVRKFAVRRTWDTAGGKKRTKAPKIQRIITESRLRSKNIQKREKKDRILRTQKAQDEYKKFLEEWRIRKASKKSADIARKKSSVDQTAANTKPAATTQKPVATKVQAKTDTKKQNQPVATTTTTNNKTQKTSAPTQTQTKKDTK